MRLERHVGGLGLARSINYLERRGWIREGDRWLGPHPDPEPERLPRAVHRQLTADLCAALAPRGWKVTGYTPRGYAQLEDTTDGTRCTLPAALRRQARRERTPVREFTYLLFLAALETGQPGGAGLRTPPG